MFGANLYERHLPVLARQLTPSAVEGTAKNFGFHTSCYWGFFYRF
ncbi:hypothetical protein NIES2098_49190 [Calothrix sp. NIES-2098]|jgi:hypothetical protein|nr:hypothetical protein NIES2098_49190 [Calothrix sp. NIES-2098]